MTAVTRRRRTLAIWVALGIAITLATALLPRSADAVATDVSEAQWHHAVGTVEITRPETGVSTIEVLEAWVAPDGRWRVKTEPASGFGVTSEWVHSGGETTLTTSSHAGDVSIRAWAGTGHYAVNDLIERSDEASRALAVSERATVVERDARGRISLRVTTQPDGSQGVVERYEWDSATFAEEQLEPTVSGSPAAPTGAIDIADMEGRLSIGILPMSGGAKSHGTTLLSAIDSEQCLYIYNSRDPEADWLYGKSSRVGTCRDVEVRLWRDAQVMSIGFCEYGGTLIGTATATYTATKSSYSAYVSPTCTSHDAYNEDGFHVVNSVGYSTLDWAD